MGKHFCRPSLKGVRYLAIDEIAIGAGHHYLTIVINPEPGEVLFVGDGKGSEALIPFWKRLKRSKARIEAVAMDMPAVYIKAASENLPDAVIVFDHFHVVKLMKEKLTKLRRQLYKEATGILERKVLKGTMWLLLKNPENLDEEKGEGKRLGEALKLNESLFPRFPLFGVYSSCRMPCADLLIGTASKAEFLTRNKRIAVPCRCQRQKSPIRLRSGVLATSYGSRLQKRRPPP